MKTLTTLLLVLSCATAHAQTTQQTIRNPNGQVIGRTVTDSRGATTFYNPLGQQTGRATVDSRGVTTFRDSSGRVTGTSRR